MAEIRPEYLEGKKVGVIAGSTHEAYLKAMFTDAVLTSFANDDALQSQELIDVERLAAGLADGAPPPLQPILRRVLPLDLVARF